MGNKIKHQALSSLLATIPDDGLRQCLIDAANAYADRGLAEKPLHIVVCVEGGCVTAVYHNKVEPHWAVVDWDNAKGGDEISLSIGSRRQLPAGVLKEVDKHNRKHAEGA